MRLLLLPLLELHLWCQLSRCYHLLGGQSGSLI
jgi:hypothetical protein